MKTFIALVLMVASLPALAAPPAKFAARVDAVRTAAEVPGMAIAIVENGTVTLARGFGVRKLGSPEKVDGDTIFMTGSTGKAMTTAALATLVDAGKLKWDDRVTDHIPGFQMYDPYVARELTVRDVLSHRSGLARGDLMWYATTYDRSEILRRVRYLKPSWSFRSNFGYQNIMYLAGGQAASGRPAAVSRSCIARSGSSDCAFISAQGSPAERTRPGTVTIVSASGWITSSSSQSKGVDTCAPGRARTDQAPNTVLCGAFWLKSTKTRWPRSSFHQAHVISSGRRRSSSRATATAALRTS